MEVVRPLFLKVEQCGVLLGCHKSKVYSMINTGELPSIKIGGMLRVPRAAIELMAARAMSQLEQREPETSVVAR